MDPVRSPFTAAHAAFLALVFGAELAMWAAWAWSAHALAGGGWVGLAAGASAFVVATLAWGLWAAPRSHAPRWATVAVKTAEFAGAVALLAVTGEPGAAAALAAFIAVAHLGARFTAPPSVRGRRGRHPHLAPGHHPTDPQGDRP